MTKKSLIEKIKSLLALATGVGNENEKQLALKRAQELMAKYSVDVVFARHPCESTPTIEQIRYETKLDLPISLRTSLDLAHTIEPICQNFGVYVAYNLAGHVLLWGFKTNLEVAIYACETLLYQGIQDFKREYRRQRTMGFGISFWKGFREGLKVKFDKSIIPENALVLYDQVKQEWMRKVTFGSGSFNQSNANGMELGIQSARDAVLNKGIESTMSGRLLK